MHVMKLCVQTNRRLGDQLILVIMFTLGGKWTTYRSMAVDAVDAAVKKCELKQKQGSGTDGLILDGGYHWTPNHYIKLAQDYGNEMFWINCLLNLSQFYFDQKHLEFLLLNR